VEDDSQEMCEGGAFYNAEGGEGGVGIWVAEVGEHGDEPGDGEGLSSFYTYRLAIKEERTASHRTYPSDLLPC